MSLSRNPSLSGDSRLRLGVFENPLCKLVNSMFMSPQNVEIATTFVGDEIRCKEQHPLSSPLLFCDFAIIAQSLFQTKLIPWFNIIPLHPPTFPVSLITF